MRIRFAGALLVAGLVASACSTEESVGPRAPVLLVTIDTLRADRLGVYGYGRETSPELDALAAESTVFENIITPMATTLPAHVSLMTSTHTLTHGIKGNFAHMGERFGAAGIRTAAEVFAQQGYATAAFVSAAPLKDHTGIQIGFEHFDQPENRDQLAETTIDRVLQWLNDRAADRPYFVWVHLWDPHSPYTPPADYDTFQDDAFIREFLSERGVEPNARTLGWNNGYDGEIRYTDAQLGRLFQTLRSDDTWDTTAIVVTSDHGEGLGQHGWRDHGRIHNEQLFVPLIVKWPAGVARPPRVRTLGSTLDAFPTLLAGLDLPLDDALRAQFEGLDLLDRAAAERQYVLAERTHRERDWGDGNRYALLSSAWKYLHATEGPDRLFDLASDAHELTDTLASQPGIGDSMFEVIELVLQNEQEFERGQIPSDRLEQLRALGYVQ